MTTTIPTTETERLYTLLAHLLGVLDSRLPGAVEGCRVCTNAALAVDAWVAARRGVGA